MTIGSYFMGMTTLYNPIVISRLQALVWNYQLMGTVGSEVLLSRSNLNGSSRHVLYAGDGQRSLLH